MRILIILKYIPSANHHQKSDLFRSTIDAHVMEGHEVVLLTTGKKSKHEWNEIDVKWGLLKNVWTVIIRKYLNNVISLYSTSFVAKKVAKYHELYPIDLVFAECTGDHPAIHAYVIKRALGIPYVVREHRMYGRSIRSADDLKEIYLRALRAADAVLSVSPLNVKLMKNLGIRDDIDYIPNAIPDDFFSPPAKDGSYRAWAGNEFIFAGWTRWRVFKRIDLLLIAFKQILENGCQARLVIAGPIEPDENKQWVHSYIKENDLTGKVLLTGQVPRSEIHQLAYECDCCVIPSDYETFGLPALEAMAAGKPVVTTRCNGPEFLVDSFKLGRVVECDSAKEIFKGMLEVYMKYDSFDEFEIRRSAFKRFSCSAVARHFTALYENLVGVKK